MSKKWTVVIEVEDMLSDEPEAAIKPNDLREVLDTALLAVYAGAKFQVVEIVEAPAGPEQEPPRVAS